MAAGRLLLEQEGPEALTMRRLAERVGIRAPSLYKHLPDKKALETAIIATGLEEAAAIFEQAVTESAAGVGARAGAGADGAGAGAGRALVALAAAYRGFALEHPHLYRLMNNGPVPREQLPPGLEDRAATPLVRAAGSQDRARAVWAFAHGMVMLELDHRFPPGADLDAAWRAGIAAFQPADPRPPAAERLAGS